jgi:hypothetical protein
VLCETIEICDELIRQFRKLIKLSPEDCEIISLHHPTAIIDFRDRRFILSVEPSVVLLVTQPKDLWFCGLYGDPPDYDEVQFWSLDSFQQNDDVRGKFNEDGAVGLFKRVVCNRYNGYAGHGNALLNLKELKEFHNKDDSEEPHFSV